MNNKLNGLRQIKKRLIEIMDELENEAESNRHRFKIKKPTVREKYAYINEFGAKDNRINNEFTSDKSNANFFNYEIGPNREKKTENRIRRTRARNLLYKCADAINEELGEFEDYYGIQIRKDRNSDEVIIVYYTTFSDSAVFHPDTELKYITEIFKKENVDINDLWLR